MEALWTKYKSSWLSKDRLDIEDVEGTTDGLSLAMGLACEEAERLGTNGK